MRIKRLMTPDTQRNIVASVTKILFTYISPLKVSLHTFWNLFKTTMFTTICFTKSKDNPPVLDTIRSGIAFPQIVIITSIIKPTTRFGTVFNTFFSSKVEICSTDNTRKSVYFSGINSTTFLRTEKYFKSVSFNRSWRQIKDTIAYMTITNHRLIIQ